ncbi:MAG: sulfatase-like hydrolase/transferase [Planctomycetota bacterium]
MHSFTRALAIGLVGCFVATSLSAQPLTRYIDTDDDWRYLDDGSDQGVAWRQPGFDDSSWKEDQAQFGYGDGDEGTTLSFGPDPNLKFVTTYFRYEFRESNPGRINALRLRLLRDDGAVVYLNGTEVARSNMPLGVPTNYLMLAASESEVPTEQTFYEFSIDPALLVRGNNVLAAELHQAAGGTEDASFAAELVGARGSARPFAQENLLILVADDLGVDNVGAYGEGSAIPPTPNIDALASQGVLFRNFWSNPVCSPTRACLHTGRYSLRTLVGHAVPLQQTGVLDLTEISIPKMLDLGNGGYAHSLIGKWHLGDERNGGDLGPNMTGWSHFAGLIPGALGDYYNWRRTVDGVTAQSTVYATTQMVDDALSWIGQQSGPWVCMLAFNAAHGPLQPPPPSLHSQNLNGLNPATTPVPFYKAIAEAMDTEIGRLLASLGPQRQNTNVIFLGDNGTDGPVSVPPFRPSHAKGTPYEGAVNVPLIFAGPTVTSPGREVDALVGAVDLFATVAELAQVDLTTTLPPTLEIDSVSFLPYITDPAQTPIRQTVFAELFNGSDFATVNTTGFAIIRDSQYKLVRFHDGVGREEFYDLIADPFETNDLLAVGLSPGQEPFLNALRAEIDLLRNPTASLTLFGETNCFGSNGATTLGVSGTARLGDTYTVSLTNGAPYAPALLFLVNSRFAFGPVALPFPLEVIGGAPGCYQYVAPGYAFTTTTDAAGAASLPIPVPSSPDLVGLDAYHAWLVVDQQAGGLGVTTSNGLVAVVGF